MGGRSRCLFFVEIPIAAKIKRHPNIGKFFGEIAVNLWNIQKIFMKIAIIVAIRLEYGYNFVTDTFAARRQPMGRKCSFSVYEGVCVIN